MRIIAKHVSVNAFTCEMCFRCCFHVVSLSADTIVPLTATRFAQWPLQPVSWLLQCVSNKPLKGFCIARVVSCPDIWLFGRKIRKTGTLRQPCICNFGSSAQIKKCTVLSFDCCCHCCTDIGSGASWSILGLSAVSVAISAVAIIACDLSWPLRGLHDG